MRRLTSWLAVGICTALVGIAFAATATAQTVVEESSFDLTEPLDVGGTVLEAGSYQIKVVRSRLDRNMLRVMSADGMKVIATVLSIPHPEGPAGVQIPESRFVYYPAGAGPVKVLRTWYASNTPSSGGHDIVYPKERAMELAALAEEPVVAVPDEVKVAELETAPLVVVTPKKEVKPYEAPPPEVAPAEQVKVAESAPRHERLPQTASNVPLYAGLGLLSLLGALGLGALVRRVA